MWARISVLNLYVRIRNLRVRIRIEGCGWGQGLEDWALLIALEIQIIMYSSTQRSTFGNFYVDFAIAPTRRRMFTSFYLAES